MIRTAKNSHSISVACILMLALIIPSAYGQLPDMGPQRPEAENILPAGCGFIPPPMDLSHLTGQNLSSLKKPAAPAPSSWDWRVQGKVTSIRNQGNCGSCYAFAALANFEAKMLIDNEGTFNFSENNAKECNYSDLSCDGGTYYDLASLFATKGVVLESCDPYVASDVSCNTSCVPEKVLLDWRIICADNIPSSEVLKDYVYNYGPIYTTLNAGQGDAWETEFGSYNGSYTLYHTGTAAPNHAVLIVGYDDDIANDSGGTGAWIVKNSWGTGWGGTCGYGTQGGYFTIAYGSANIGMWSSYAAEWQDYDAEAELLYHDDAGWNCNYGWPSSTAWGLCKFIPGEEFTVSRVEFWTNDATTDVDIYIYDGFNGTSLSGLMNEKLNLSFAEAGYHSVALDSTVTISAGNDFYAVVKFTNASATYPICADLQGPTTTGNTYISASGFPGSWFEVSGGSGVDVGIRVRKGTSLILDVDDDQVLPTTYGLSQNRPNPFNPATTIVYTLESRAQVNLSVFNLLGQKIVTLVDDVKLSGEHRVTWDGRDTNGNPMSTGVYFYSLTSEEFVATKKMVLLR